MGPLSNVKLWVRSQGRLRDTHRVDCQPLLRAASNVLLEIMWQKIRVEGDMALSRFDKRVTLSMAKGYPF